MSEERKFLTFDDIKASRDLQEADVDLTEHWGGWVKIREMSAGDRDFLEASMIHAAKSGEGLVIFRDEKSGLERALDDFRIKVAMLSLVNPETDGRMFTRQQVASGEAYEVIKAKSHEAIGVIATAAFDLNKLGEEDIKELGEGLGRALSGSSSSDSPSNEDVPLERLSEP